MTAERSPAATLDRLLGGRDGLREPFRAASLAVAARTGAATAAAWQQAVLDLLTANTGPGCLLAFLRLSAQALPERIGCLPAIARTAIAICRHAGGGAAQGCLEAVVRDAAAPAPWDADGPWWGGFIRLARDAPECVPLLAARAETVLRASGAAGFAAFVAAGLRHAGRDRSRRRAFFTLEEPAAGRELERQAGAISFATEERALTLLGRALWGGRLVLRPIPTVPGRPRPRRSRLAGGVVLMPETFPGLPPAQARTLFRAAAVHAGAHVAFTPARFAMGTLKPLQCVLVGAIEDARVEALAMRRYPGLRRLWQPFHLARPEGGTAPALLARLARALFDPDYGDTHGFVVKARALFGACAQDLEDATLSRRIGGLLGNDLGQMRVQFDPGSYVVEPAYRDDGFGLWDVSDPADPASDPIELLIDAAAPHHATNGQPGRGSDPDAADTRHARPAGTSDGGIVLARYPEWDPEARIERPEWTCVREVPAMLGDAAWLEEALSGLPDLGRRIDRLVRAARPGRPIRLRRQPEGPDLDLDAVIAAATAQASGLEPDERIFRLTALRRRDLATTLLLDVSESTRDRVGRRTVLDLERIAIALLGDTLARLGDPFALLAFASDGREAVRLIRVKDFAEQYGAAAKARLAGLRPGLSTRLGAAIRHAGAEIGRVRSFRRLVLVLSDGEPSDIDVADPSDLVEDARRAGQGLRAQGIDLFGVIVSDAQGAATAATRIFGVGGFVMVRRPEELPARLSDLYFRLTRR